MADLPKAEIKYIIVHDDGTGIKEFLELFNNNWGVVIDRTTGNAVHYLMRKEVAAPPKPAIETLDNKIETGAPLVPPHMFSRKGKRR